MIIKNKEKLHIHVTTVGIGTFSVFTLRVHPSDNEVYVRQWNSNAKAIAMVHSRSFSKLTPHFATISTFYIAETSKKPFPSGNCLRLLADPTFNISVA